MAFQKIKFLANNNKAPLASRGIMSYKVCCVQEVVTERKWS